MTPTIKRRLTAMVYETFLLLAVEMLAVALFLVVTRNNHAPVFQYAMKVWLFIVTGAYFTWGWTNSGHTLAMKTWRMQVVTAGGARLPLTTAIVRYLLAWGWFLPALLACTALGLKDKAQIGAAVTVGVLAWGLTAFAGRDRQFLHDRLAGTRLVLLPKPVKAGAPAEAAEAS